jgi:hypothetical protein
MKKTETVLIAMLSAVLLAVNTDWCKPAKYLVMVASLAGIAVGVKTLAEVWSERE